MGPAGLRGLPGAPGAQGPTGAAGLRGPAGVRGVPGANGADGIIGSIHATVPTATALPATAAQGEIDYVEDEGKLYVYDEQRGWVELNVAQGPRGVTGPKGDQGADGVMGIIKGVVDTPAALPATGNTQGDIYYVQGDGLYVWDAATGWRALGMVQGPRGLTGTAGATGAQGAAGAAGATGSTGATGPAGVQGADGIVGSITAAVPTRAQLPATGEPEDIYYVEDEAALYLWDAATQSWVLLDIAQGPRGYTGPTGPAGPQGEDGLMGPIKGVVATQAALPAGGAQQGDLYYVEDTGSLYAWDAAEGWVNVGLAQGPRGLTGATGPTGAATPASSYMMVPFASGVAPLTHMNNGLPSRVTLLGFGYGDARVIADYSLPIDASDQSFLLTKEADSDNRQVVFSLPFNVTLKSIYLTAGNYDMFSPDNEIFPYVQLFRADPGSNNFTVIQGATAIPLQGIRPGDDIPADTFVSAHTDNLDIKLAAGTRIGIGALMRSPGHTGADTPYFLYFTGGIGFAVDA